MSAKFNLIHPDKDISEAEGFGSIFISAIVIVSVVVISLLYFQLPPAAGWLILMFLAFGFRPLTRRFYADWVKDEDIIGELLFDVDSIAWSGKLNNETLDVKHISAVDLVYNYVKGRQFSYKDIIHNGLAVIVVKMDSGNIVTLKFVIEKTAQIDSLKPIWREYYRQGIKIRESMGKYEVKTILFKGNLSFEDIKKFKEELNTDHFY